MNRKAVLRVVVVMGLGLVASLPAQADDSLTRALGTEAVTISYLPLILAIAEALHLQVIVEGI